MKHFMIYNKKSY